ncbi:MAG: hypothetical protein F6J97_21615 [Leptolyngbya sp. SIO4C1]|nr:hypothetical protein [Leptolyngbya sp. SIO4C1]
MGKQRLILAAILALTLAAVVVIIQVPTQLGLDLRGGSQLTIQVQPTEQIPQVGERELEAVQRVVEGRVNGLGVSEAVVQSAGQDQLIVQLPGVSDPEQAERVLGGTAQLEFRKQKPSTEGELQAVSQVLQQQRIQQELLRESGDAAAIAANRDDLAASRETLLELFEPTELTGDKLRDALARPIGTSNAWEVVLEFNDEGGDLFAKL